jgi:hypothetical protein
VKELNEMTIGRTHDPENPQIGVALEAAKVFGTGSRNPIWASGHGAASTGRTHDRNRPPVKLLVEALASEGPSTHADLESV